MHQKQTCKTCEAKTDKTTRRNRQIHDYSQETSTIHPQKPDSKPARREELNTIN